MTFFNEETNEKKYLWLRLMATIKLRNASLVSECILRVSEKLPVFKVGYFGKYIIQLYSYLYVHVSGQRQTGLER